MIVEEKIVNIDINKCLDTLAISGNMDSKEININVTTCFESEQQEGIFDDSFDSTFE